MYHATKDFKIAYQFYKIYKEKYRYSLWIKLSQKNFNIGVINSHLV